MTTIISDRDNSMAFYSIFAVIIFFAAYYYFAERRVLLRFFSRLESGILSKPVLEFLSEKTTGILMSGIAPLILFTLLLKQGSEITNSYTSAIKASGLLIYALPPLAMLISFFSAKNPGLWNDSPQLREKKWHLGHIVLSAAVWIIYILGYEFFFRGILWFTCYKAFGFTIALAINVILYSLVHIPKGAFMTAGAVPLGIILCCMSYLSGSFFPAFLIHAGMAVTTEISAAYHNPEFQVSFRKQFKKVDKT